MMKYGLRRFRFECGILGHGLDKANAAQTIPGIREDEIRKY